ncbi:beta-lactamase family protein [Kitasatospora sp. NBC_01250]|uniref:serine hydrolase domain-containing protein n=1 Tax=unclassified Kitasatospora TaxID=2633591 RepID=UPI002E0D5F88|nr:MULTISPECIES: serine hydrolase domain-containing protein [unclassified Kitasatospora]WSJ71778.1 beta-lactamase family protein [Kitasatospora sp. NBC_01302]
MTAPSNPAQTRVQEILDELTVTGEETGIQVAAYLDGELVVDAWSGLADVASGALMEGETLVPSWSTGKGVAATLVAVLVDQRILDYDAPISSYWPEFGAQGKQQITLGQLLSHSAGVPQLRPDLSPEELLDPPTVAAWLAAQPPLWAPGTATGYHAWTFGVLLAEILHRSTGRSCEQLLRDELAAPLGVADTLLFSVPDQLLPRLATCYDGTWAARLAAMPDDSPFLVCAPRTVSPVAELANRADFRRTALPANSTLTARAAARMYAMLACGEVDGVRLLSDAALKTATAPRTLGVDRILGLPIPKSYGFMLGGPGSGIRTGDQAFGMSGSGGSGAYADPLHRFSFALTKNRMAMNGTDERIVRAIHAALGIAAG